MNQDERSPEKDRAIEEALADLGICDRPAGDTQPEEVRAYRELLGLLPYELPAEAPPSHVKRELMAGLREQSTSAEPATAEPAMAPVTQLTPRAPAPPSNFRTYALAAMLALCLIGLGALGNRVLQQNGQIERLEQQVAALDAPSALVPVANRPQASVPTSGTVEMAQIRSEMDLLRDRLNMVTRVARQAYPMRRVNNNPSAGGVEGSVYVCGQHQRWYLNLQGLEQPPEGSAYHLWFMTKNGKRDGGILEVSPEGTAEREAFSMPEGTSGFEVTLERQGEPESLTILLGENAINL